MPTKTRQANGPESKTPAHKPYSPRVESQRRRMAGDVLCGRCFVVPLPEPHESGVTWNYQGWSMGRLSPAPTSS